MSDWETTIIPLDDAHEILSPFGIGPYSRGYERWRRDDGFRHVDFEDVLTESPLVLIVDWRRSQLDMLEDMATQLGRIGVEASAELDEDAMQGELVTPTGRVKVTSEIDAQDGFDPVVKAINRLIAPAGLYKKFRSCEGTDGWVYALLSVKSWNELESAAAKTVNLIFMNVD